MKSIAGRILMIPQGVYDSNKEYHMLDIVTENNIGYIARRTVQCVSPTSDNGDNWQPIIDVSSLLNKV